MVVVSEETGTISVADNGRLIRNLSVEGLESLLMDALSRPVLSVARLGFSKSSYGDKDDKDKDDMQGPDKREVA